MTEPAGSYGVEASAAAWEPAPQQLLPRPVQGAIDYDALIDRIHSDFPKTLARLAE